MDAGTCTARGGDVDLRRESQVDRVVCQARLWADRIWTERADGDGHGASGTRAVGGRGSQAPAAGQEQSLATVCFRTLMTARSRDIEGQKQLVELLSAKDVEDARGTLADAVERNEAACLPGRPRLVRRLR